MNTAALVLVTSVTIAGTTALPGSPAPGATPPAAPGAAPDTRPSSPSTVLDHARTLPKLPLEQGAITIPLRGTDPFTWRPIRDGVTINGGETLRVTYTRTRGQAAGSALVVRPGTFDGFSAIRLSIAGNRSQTLYLNLKQADGTVWTLGPISVRTGEPREVVLRAEDIELDPYQNRGRKGAAFDAASVYMLTLLDISGHMSPAEPECEWTVTSLKAVRP